VACRGTGVATASRPDPPGTAPTPRVDGAVKAEHVIRVLIADDHPVVIAGVHRLLSRYHDIQLVGEAADGSSLVELVKRTLPDVVLLDISMPGPGFAQVIRALRRDCPRLAVLVLSGQPESQYAVRALRAGASGYLGKESLAEQLADAIRCTADGRRYVSPTAADSLVTALTDDSVGAPHEALSDREFEVLKSTAMGKSVKQIAHELHLSPKTVSTYRRRVLDKLNLDSQAKAIRYAVGHGIVGDASLDAGSDGLESTGG
jgi:two-component system invasion response regulator UvrY